MAASPQPVDCQRGTTLSPPELIARIDRELGDALAAPAAASQPQIDEAQRALRALIAEHACAQLGEALYKLGHLCFMRSRTNDGLAAVADAEAVARRIGELPLLRKVLTIRGVFLMETANTPQATRCLSEALDLAQAQADLRGECAVWNNLGALLMQSSLTAEAVACFERVLLLAAADPQLADARARALANAALAAYFERDLGRGYRLCRQGIDELADPQRPADLYTRTVLEATFARVLSALGDARSAREHAAAARNFADRCQMPRAELAAELALGLVEVEGKTAADFGLSRIQRMAALARAQVPIDLIDTLTAAVSAYERAGQADVALLYLNELLKLNRESKAKHVLMHHHQHLARVQQAHGLEADAVGDQLCRQRGRLRGRLAEADHERIRNLGQLVEQQALAAERLDDATGEHCYRVGRLASILGREVDLEDDVCFLIDLAARLHDIGKLVVPDALLLKPGKLTPGERLIMETHTVAGWEILGQTNIPQMHIAQEIARHHHERWDGTGYPDRLVGQTIPIAARVSALADVFDALTHRRPYKEAWSIAEALAEIKRLRGRQFDPEITDVFLELVPRLQREHPDLDAFLGADAKHSPFIQARERIARALKGADPDVSLFELRR